MPDTYLDIGINPYLIRAHGSTVVTPEMRP